MCSCRSTFRCPRNCVPFDMRISFVQCRHRKSGLRLRGTLTPATPARPFVMFFADFPPSRDPVRRGLPLVLILGGGCEPVPAAGALIIDTAPHCEAVEVDELATDLDAWAAGTRVLAAAHMAPSAEAFWLLASRVDETGAATLEALYADSMGVIDRAPVGVRRRDTRLELLPEPGGHDAWLVETGSRSLNISRFSYTSGRVIVARSGNLRDSAHDPGACSIDTGAPLASTEGPSSCNYTGLVFLDARPFLVAVPSVRPDASIQFRLTELNVELRLEEPRLLEPMPACPDAVTCASGSPMAVTVLAAQRTTQYRSWSTVLQLARVETAGAEEPAAPPGITSVTLATVEFDDDGVLTASLRPQRHIPNLPLLGAPWDNETRNLVRDDFAFYWSAHGESGTVVLMSRDPASSVEPLVAYPYTDETFHMLQLEDDVAVGWEANGLFQILKVFPAAPLRSTRRSHRAASPVRDLQPAGDGVFLIERVSGGPDLVRLRCSGG